MTHHEKDSSDEASKEVVLHPWKTSFAPVLAAVFGLTFIFFGGLAVWGWLNPGELASAGEAPALFALLSLVAFYWGLVKTFNATRIQLDSKGLRLTHGPLPFKRGRFVPRDEIVAFEVEKKEQPSFNPGGMTVYDYQVLCRCEGGGDVVLVVESDEREARELAAHLHRRAGLSGLSTSSNAPADRGA